MLFLGLLALLSIAPAAAWDTPGGETATTTAWWICLFPAALALAVTLMKTKYFTRISTYMSMEHTNQMRKDDSKSEKEKAELSKMLISTKCWHDKIVFTSGVTNALFTAYMMGTGNVEMFTYWFTVKSAVLLSIRLYKWVHSRDFLFFLEFCYWGNLLTLFCIWYPRYLGVTYDSMPPWYQTCFRVAFVIGNGPIAWSVVVLSNKMIFHNTEYMTSLLIHSNPMLVFYVCRATKSPFVTQSVNGVVTTFTGLYPGVEELSFDTWSTAVCNGIKYFYLPWITLYSIFMFVIFADILERYQLENLFSWHYGKSKAMQNFHKNKHVVELLYSLGHLLAGSVGCCLSALLLFSKEAHFLFMAVMMIHSIWNAADSYFDLFAKKYMTNLKLKYGIKEQ